MNFMKVSLLILKMAVPVVKGPGGKTYELLEGMKVHFLSLYGEWKNGTIMCPPLFPREFTSPVGDIHGVPPLSENVLNTIMGDHAEEKIYDILQEFGKKENEPMFVLSKLKFTEFIRYCMPRHSDHTIDTGFQVEIDFAIVHLNIGVILVEVKSSDKCDKWQKRNASNQLSKGEKIIKALLDEDSCIPVYKVAAFPNGGESVFFKDDIVVLKKSDVGSCEVFSLWMHSHFDSKKCGSQEKQDELRHLLYKLVGQRTKVSSSLETVKFSDKVHPRNEIPHRCYNIFRQASLSQRYECSVAKNKGEKPTGLRKTADEPGLAVMTKDIVFLNSEQLCIFEGSNHQLISGVSGSGKTILLQYKALECVKKGEKIIICVPSPLDKKYAAFFEEKKASSGVSIYTFESIGVLKSEEPFHLFVDEVQILYASRLTIKAASLMMFMHKEKSSDNNYYYCWFAYDDTQFMPLWDYIYLNEFPHAAREKPGYCAMTFIGIGDMERTGIPTLVKSHLKTVMRSTEQVFGFVKEFAHKSDIYSQILKSKQFSSDCNGRSDVPPSLKEEWQGIIGHRIGGFQVNEVESDSLEEVLASIFREVHVQRQKLKEVAVLVTNDWMLEDLSAMCKVVGIPLCAVGEAKDALVLDHGSKTHSFEWPVVIAVCGSESDPNIRHVYGGEFYFYILRYLMFSRAVVKLVVFNVKRSLKESGEEEVLSYLTSKESILDKIFFSANLQQSE